MPNDEVKLPVIVKPIGWMDNGANSLWSGELIFGVYYTLYDEANGWRVFREQFLSEGGPDEVAFIRELDAAKAAAQADYEQRILSTLSAIPSTVSGETLAAYIEALTPSAGTKAEYIGEFTIAVERFINEDAEPDDGPVDPYDHIQVPWTTIKQIMAAIRARAERSPANPAETQAVEVGK